MNFAAQVTEKVKEQYEALPYPPRDPKAEKNMLHARNFCSLDQLSYYCFEGKLPDEMRVLVAGGGTGDSTIFLAEQLKHRGGSVVHLDLSEASTNIAKERAKVRKLDNIEFILDSLLDLPKMGLGEFDYIDCIGVLHHLADPQAGLDALKSVLKDSGAMGIMVYALYGRAAVYQIQNLLKIALPEDMNIPDKLSATKGMLASLPPGNWFKLDETPKDDHLVFGDSGLYDLFLHPQDRAYTVPQIYEFAEKSGLEMLGFVRENGLGKILYEAKYSIKDPKTLQILESLPVREQHAAMEIFNNRGLKIHQFYLAKNPRKIPDISDTSLVPYFSCYIDNIDASKIISSEVAKQTDEFRVTTNGRTVGHKKNPATHVVIEAIDNQRTIAEIIDYVSEKTEGKFDKNFIYNEVKKIFSVFSVFDWMFLRQKDSNPTLIPSQVQLAAVKRMMS